MFETRLKNRRRFYEDTNVNNICTLLEHAYRHQN